MVLQITNSVDANVNDKLLQRLSKPSKTRSLTAACRTARTENTALKTGQKKNDCL